MNKKETAPRKHRGLKISHVLIILLLIGAAAFALFRLRLKSKLRARIDAIRAAGYPVTCAELDKWYTIPEDTENAAYTYMDAFWCYKELGETESLPFIGKAKLPIRTEPLPEDMMTSIARYIADNNEALTLLHKASAIEYCRYPIDLSIGFNTQLNHLHKIIECIILLMIDVIWHAENDQSQSAANSLMSGFALARSLANEPVIISQSSRMVCLSIIISGLKRAINRTIFTDEQLADLDRCIIETESCSTLARAYVGDRCDFMDVLKKPESLKPGFTVDGKQISPMNTTFSDLYKAVGLADIEAMIYLDFIDEYIEITKLPPHQRKKASDALEARLASLSHIHVFLHMLRPTLSRTARTELRSIAGLRAARAGIGVERYRLATGKLPDSLMELVPVYLESVPKDPFDGDEIRYRKLEAGFVVYSIDKDLSDDGGKEITRESKNWDMTFIVER